MAHEYFQNRSVPQDISEKNSKPKEEKILATWSVGHWWRVYFSLPERMHLLLINSSVNQFFWLAVSHPLCLRAQSDCCCADACSHTSITSIVLLLQNMPLGGSREPRVSCLNYKKGPQYPPVLVFPFKYLSVGKHSEATCTVMLSWNAIDCHWVKTDKSLSSVQNWWLAWFGRLVQTRIKLVL